MYTRGGGGALIPKSIQEENDNHHRKRNDPYKPSSTVNGFGLRGPRMGHKPKIKMPHVGKYNPKYNFI
jgi:hypothetical protein